MTDPDAVLENARPAVEAMKDGRSQDYMLSAAGCIALWDALAQQTARVEALEPIVAERARQDAKWGVQDHDDALWLAILVEEVGEAAECICRDADGDAPSGSLDKEVTQIASVAVAWLECRRRAALTASHGEEKT